MLCLGLLRCFLLVAELTLALVELGGVSGNNVGESGRSVQPARGGEGAENGGRGGLEESSCDQAGRHGEY